MPEQETADIQIRVYPSTYKKLKEAARKRRTIIAEVVDEKFRPKTNK